MKDIFEKSALDVSRKANSNGSTITKISVIVNGLLERVSIEELGKLLRDAREEGKSVHLIN